MHNKSKYLGILLAAVAQPALAQSEPGEQSGTGSDTQDNVIMVTAQRKSESLLTVPVAVTALGSDTLDRRGIAQPTDLASVVPNVQVNDSRGGSEPNFTIRGIGIGNDYSSNQASPVGVYVDDAYLAFRSFYGGQMFDLQRVEVLRGPQGTLFGRNTTGGAVNFITRKPELAGTQGYLELGYGNFNAITASAAIEGELVPDVLGVRIAASYSNRDGYVDNLFPGAPDLTDDDNLRTRLSVRLRPTDTLDIDLRVYANRSHPWQPGAHGIGLVGGVNPVTGYSRAGLDFYEVETDEPVRADTNSEGGALTAMWDGGGAVSLQSLTSYGSGRSQFGQDTDNSPLSVLQTDYRSDYEEFSQELRLVYSEGPLEFQAGGYYGRDRVDLDNSLLLLGFLDDLNVPPDPFLVNGGASILQDYRQVRISKALFGQGDFEIITGLTLTGGLRYTWDTARFENGVTAVGDYDFNPFAYLIGDPSNPLDREGENRALTGRAALSYEFPTGEMIYASYSRGYRAGTFNGSAYFDPSQVNFVPPEHVNAYEVGAKASMLDGALNFSLAGFWYDYSNQQIQDIVGTVIFLRNAGKSEIKGIELEADAELAPGFDLHANIGYTHARFTELTLEGIDLSGNQLPFSPDLTAGLRAELDIGSIGDGDLTLLPSVNYLSSQWFTPYNAANGNAPLQQDGYALVDLGLEWSNGDWTVRLWGKNLTETEYYTYGANLVSFGFNYLMPGNPRTYGMSVRREF